MYLNLLNSNQKELFRQLCVYLMKADRVVDKREIDMLKGYCKEMDIPFSNQESYLNISDLISDICNISSNVEKRIIAFELIGMVYADEVIKKEEYDCIKIYSELSNIPMDIMSSFEDIVKRIYSINNELMALINNV